MKKLLLYLLISPVLQAQTLPDGLQEMLEINDIDDSQLAYLYDYLETPLDLNKCSFYDLLQLQFLEKKEVAAILEYRKSRGHFRSVYELQAIQDLSRSTISLLLHFVVVQPLSANLIRSRHLIITSYQTQLEGQKEYQDGHYVGSKHKHQLRYRTTFKNMKWGMLTEKDMGERWLDFNSFHFSYTKHYIRLLLGDYQLSLGQGLLHYQGFSFGKSSDVLNVFRKSNVLRAHTSSRESHFLRGIAIEQQLKKWKVSTWFSVNNIDANIDESSNVVTSLQDAGLHRTESEIEHKNQLLETLYGARVHLQKKQLNTSLYFVANHWNKPVMTVSDTTSYSIGIGGDYSLTYRNAHFFGELVCVGTSISAISAMNVHISKRLAISLLFRKYDHEHNSWSANGFGEQSNTRNETGLYTALNLDLNKRWSIALYTDYFSFPYSSYYTTAKQRGSDVFLQLHHQSSKSFRFHSRIQWESKLNDQSDASGLQSIERQNKIKIRSQMSGTFNDFGLKSRLSWHYAENQWGYLIHQDVSYKPLEKRWAITLRYQLFDTPSYASRIFAYEPDVLYAFSVPSFYGEGQRIVGVIKYRFIKKWTINLKLAQTAYFDNTPIRGGSVQGHTLTDIKILLRWIF